MPAYQNPTPATKVAEAMTLIRQGVSIKDAAKAVGTSVQNIYKNKAYVRWANGEEEADRLLGYQAIVKVLNYLRMGYWLGAACHWGGVELSIFTRTKQYADFMAKEFPVKVFADPDDPTGVKAIEKSPCHPMCPVYMDDDGWGCAEGGVSGQKCPHEARVIHAGLDCPIFAALPGKDYGRAMLHLENPHLKTVDPFGGVR